LREGDRNTRYFHHATIIRKHTNRIRALYSDQAGWIEEEDDIRRELMQYFVARWTVPSTTYSTVSSFPPRNYVSSIQNSLLLNQVIEDEVKSALWSLAEDKAPGPNGFPPFFFRAYWDILWDDMVAAIQLFFNTATMSPNWKHTYIVLIPKQPDPSQTSHFRPINLCNILYKVCAKLLANRMKSILPQLISLEQGAFIGGRSISDNILLAQEFMHDLHRASQRHSLMAIKLDMERVYTV